MEYREKKNTTTITIAIKTPVASIYTNKCNWCGCGWWTRFIPHKTHAYFIKHVVIMVRFVNGSSVNIDREQNRHENAVFHWIYALTDFSIFWFFVCGVHSVFVIFALHLTKWSKTHLSPNIPRIFCTIFAYGFKTKPPNVFYTLIKAISISEVFEYSKWKLINN